MIKIGTVFSGIGAIEQALKRLHVEHELVFACDNGDVELCLLDKETQKEFRALQTARGKRALTDSGMKRLVELSAKENEIAEQTRQVIYGLPSKEDKMAYVEKLYKDYSRKNNYVRQTYEANYPDLGDFHLDIRFLDGKDYTGKIDLLVGGSPCQAFSAVGAQCGLEDTRGTLFYEFGRIVDETKPKVFIYENVRGLTTHNVGNTWKVIQSVFDNLNYNITEPQVLNAVDYGIPQTRRRLFVIGIRKDIVCNKFEYPNPIGCKFKMQDFLEENCAYGHFFSDEQGNIVAEKVKGKPDPRFNLTPKVRDYVIKSGTKNFKTSVETDKDIARTLVKTMTQHHRAGVDNYITIGYEEDGTKKLRALTDRECLRLMGYPDSFKIVVGPMQIYRQAGNSIVVDVMMAIVKKIIETGVFE